MGIQPTLLTKLSPASQFTRLHYKTRYQLTNLHLTIECCPLFIFNAVKMANKYRWFSLRKVIVLGNLFKIPSTPSTTYTQTQSPYGDCLEFEAYIKENNMSKGEFKQEICATQKRKAWENTFGSRKFKKH